MHKSYLNCIADLKKSDWDYTHGLFASSTTDLSFLKDSISVNNADDFINEFLLKAGKGYLFEGSQFLKTDKKRPFHVVSNFLIGILIHKLCYSEDEMDLVKNNTPGYSAFQLLWMLTHFLHDYAEVLENEKTIRGKSISTIEGLFSIYDIKNNALSEYSKKIPKSLYDNIEEYFKYRISKNKIDHGIHAGLLFFDLLVKNRIKKKEKSTDDNYWNSNLDMQYRHIAQVICVHNIWVNQNEDFYNYPTLEQLNNFKPFSFKDFPFFFLMALVDTIEPIKFFHYNNNPHFLKFEVDVILKNLEFNFSAKSLSIKLKGSLKSAYISYFKHIYKNTFSWLKIEIKAVEKNSEIILDF
jgi:hypothetical protein